MIEVACKQCSKPFLAREADIKRGWGKFCSKSCKAKKQTKDTGIFGPHYKAAGKTVKQMKNGQYSKSKFGKRTGYLTNIVYDESDDEVISGDVLYSHKYRCWVDFREGADDHPFDSEAAGFKNT